MLTTFEIFILIISIGLTFHSIFSSYLMLYEWDADRAETVPGEFEPPTLRFSALLPAKDEERVIYQTIQSLWASNYPKDLLEILVICHEDDAGTKREVRRAIADIGGNVRLVTFAGDVINKPHGLNVGLANCTGDVVAVFDAEDTIAPAVFSVVNTIMLNEKVNIVQGGVQLMNYRDTWFGLHNCLEYFFWFKSRLHYSARQGVIPLGGNTVFFKRELLQSVNGWDESCLTEDAAIGMKFSVLGERIRIFYSPQLVTREEIPENVGQFIRQRTRWHQGFIQVLFKGSWRYPQLRQRFLAFYTLSYPLVQGPVIISAIVTLCFGFFVKLPVVVAMVSFLPLYALIFQLLISAVGAYSFANEYQQHMRVRDVVQLIITFLPYQFMHLISSVRATIRELIGQEDWEKTAHAGAHR